MKKDEKTRKPLDDTAAAAELFVKLPAASQDVILAEIRNLLNQKGTHYRNRK